MRGTAGGKSVEKPMGIARGIAPKCTAPIRSHEMKGDEGKNTEAVDEKKKSERNRKGQ